MGELRFSSLSRLRQEAISSDPQNGRAWFSTKAGQEVDMYLGESDWPPLT